MVLPRTTQYVLYLNMQEAREFSLANVLHSSIHVEQAVLLENVDLLTVNMRFRPSAEMFQFAQWGGESWNGDKLAEEFGAWRGLSPLRAVVAGAPGTYQQYLPRIATYFSVEILTIKGTFFYASFNFKLFLLLVPGSSCTCTSRGSL